MIRVGAILAALVLLTGCEEKVQRTCPRGEVCLHLGNMGDPISVDPARVSTVQESNIVSDMFEGLVAEDARGEAIPGVATSWSTSPNGLVWTFKLRPNARWSDGAPVTANDFVYAMRRMQDPKSASEYGYIAYVVKNAALVAAGKAPPEALGMRALDAHTLQIALEHPAPYLIELLKHHSFFPTPAHVVSKWGDGWIQPGRFVSNGAFTLVSWKLGDRLRMRKNPNYHDAANVCLDEVYYYPTVDGVSAERRVRRGELDINVDIQSNRIAYLRRPDQIPQFVHTYTWLGVAYLAFNAKSPKFQDRRVRQALAMAIDSDFIVKKLLRGGQLPAVSFLPPGVANYPGGVKPHWADWPLERRQAEARRMLAEAGYDRARPLKLAIKQRNSSDPMLYMPAIQADWRAVGVDVQLDPNESQIAYQAYRTRDFEVADASWIADYNDPLTFLELMKSTTGAQNYGDYANPAYDALLNKADHEPDARKRGDYLAQAEKLMLEDAPVAPVFYYVSKNLVRPEVTGWIDNIPDHHPRRWLCFKDAAARRARGAG